MGWWPSVWWLHARTEEDVRHYLAQRAEETRRARRRWRDQGRPTRRDWLIFLALVAVITGTGRAAGLF